MRRDKKVDLQPFFACIAFLPSPYPCLCDKLHPESVTAKRSDFPYRHDCTPLLNNKAQAEN
jgi:hypothetical protein